MFDTYELVLDVDRLHGGIPKHPELIRKWQEAHAPAELDVEEVSMQTEVSLGAGLLNADEKVEGIWTSFAQRGGRVLLEARQVKAMLKESANIVKNLPEMRNVKGKVPYLRAQLAERVFVLPTWMDLAPVEELASEERAIHVMTARGPRSALKRADFLPRVVVQCYLEVLADGVISEETLRVILRHAAMNGLGTDRSQGNGTFSWELTRQSA